jgi:hypothetical protein
MKLHLRVRPDQALKEVRRIDHAICQSGLHHWNVNSDGSVSAQSILWLFCWANNGMGSKRAADQAKLAFDRIFDRGYDWLAARITLDYAHCWRYKLGDIEHEFSGMLQPLKSK